MSDSSLENTSTKPEILRDDHGRILPGQESLNPAGKPKGARHLSTLLMEALKEKAKNRDGTDTDKTYADLVIARLIKDNIEKGARTELIFDRIDGQAKQEIDLTSGGETIAPAGIDVLEMAKRISAELKDKKTNGSNN